MKRFLFWTALIVLVVLNFVLYFGYADAILESELPLWLKLRMVLK